MLLLLLQIIQQTVVIDKAEPLIKVRNPNAKFIGEKQNAKENEEETPNHGNDIEILAKLCYVR